MSAGIVRPDVLVVVLDCARPDHFSCYGYGRDTTPFLDELAHDGVRFQNMIATAPWTLPSHASLFTGLFPSAHGATDEHRFLSPKHGVLPEHLRAAGYRTGAFCGNPWVSPQTGFGRGFDRFYTQRTGGRLTARAMHLGRKVSDRLLRRDDSGARRTNRALLRWVGESQEPFFAFVHYNETHLRFHPPPPYDRIFMPKEIGAARVRAVNQDCNAYIAGAVGMTEEDFAILTALYDGELRYADMRLREIAEGLTRLGRWDRTLMIVTADHGENLGEHRMMSHKFVLYDTLLRIPLIMRWPERIPRGFVVDELAQTTDLLPTILAMAGTEAGPTALPGRPLVRDGQATAGPAFTISERSRPNLAAFRRRYPQFDTRAFDVRKKAIRTRREKYIWHSDEADEYFDLARDPGEEHNRIEQEGERAEQLRRALFDWVASVERFADDAQGPELDALMRQQLERLGYIE